jgi:putative chitinase
MSSLNRTRLLAVMPAIVDADTWLSALDGAMDQFAVSSPPRAAAFLAQIAHESNQCRATVENLNYSAAALMRTWPKRFPSASAAAAFERNPRKIANSVYANRMGNGPTSSGDGWRFRGRGLIQLTGRSNYAAVSAALGVDFIADPDALVRPDFAARSAAWFWKSRGLNELADDKTDDDDSEDFRQITKVINGGLTGLSDRLRYWDAAKHAFGLA